MNGITTHILDTASGRPARGVCIVLYRLVAGDGPDRGNADRADAGNWGEMASGLTDADGRLRDLLPPGAVVEKGVYKLRFATKEYFAEWGGGTGGPAAARPVGSLYPFIEIVFEVTGDEHYHIPLLLSPFGYSTYRGS